MQEMFLGQAIKRRRLELGLTQEQLCEGICEPITISRLENGKQTPSRSRINAILERLDLPADRYYALLSRKELDIEALEKQIVACNIHFSHATGEERLRIREKALLLHRQLEEILDEDDRITRQLLLRSRVILGQETGPYPYAEQKSMLLEAIRLTCPSFDLDDIGRGLYTTDEIKIINQLALISVYAKEHMEAIEIYSQLYKYIRKHFHNIPPARAHLGLVAYNYSRELLIVGQYQKAIEIASEGKQSCLDSGSYHSLPTLLSVLAESNHFLGNDDVSRELYHQCYYTMKALGDTKNAEFVRADVKQYLNLEFPY